MAFPEKKILILLVWFIAISVFSQTQFGAFNQNVSSQFNGGIQYWKANEDNITQYAIPVTFAWPVNDQLRIDFITAPAFSQAQTAQDNSLAGLSDSRIRGSYLLANERFLLTFGMNLPNGKSDLTVEEQSVANILSMHVLDFRVPVLGQGFDASTGVIMAQPLGSVVLGLGAGIVYRGAYDPFKDVDLNYNPGEEFSLSAGLDIPFTRTDKMYLDFGYTIYTADQSNNVSVFQAGNRFNINGMFYFPRPIWSYLFYIKSRLQAKNQVGSGDLAPERQNSNNNETDLAAFTFLTWNRKTTFHGVVEGKFYSDNAIGVGATSMGGFGIGLEKKLSESFEYTLSTRLYFGNYHTSSKTVSLFGFQVLGGMKIYF